MPAAPSPAGEGGLNAARRSKLEALIRDPRSAVNVESLLVSCLFVWAAATLGVEEAWRDQSQSGS